MTRKRCGRDDGLVAYDIQKLFDRIGHSRMLRAVKPHPDCKWRRRDIERWRTAPLQQEDGSRVERTAGTPQGGVVRPLLANLFLHYVFDKGRVRTFPGQPWARDADDGVVHGRTEAEAKHLLAALGERFQACGLGLPPEKTRIISCKADDRRGTDPETRVDFLG